MVDDRADSLGPSARSDGSEASRQPRIIATMETMRSRLIIGILLAYFVAFLGVIVAARVHSQYAHSLAANLIIRLFFPIAGSISFAASIAAIRSGSITVGKHRKHTFTRAERPVDFWGFVLWSLLFGLFFLVIGICGNLRNLWIKRICLSPRPRLDRARRRPRPWPEAVERSAMNQSSLKRQAARGREEGVVVGAGFGVLFRLRRNPLGGFGGMLPEVSSG